MFTKTKTVLSFALFLCMASAAMAAPKHPVHHRGTAVERYLSGVSAYGYEKPGNIYPATFSPSVLQALKRQAAGDPRCWGGNCDPNWNSEGE